MTTEQKPDGYGIYNSNGTFADDFYIELDNAEYDFGESLNYKIKPVCLITPQQKARMEALELWAKDVDRLISDNNFDYGDANTQAGILMAEYDAIMEQAK